MNNNNPIALFVFNRPEHTIKCLNALKKNPEAKNTNIHIFCDGPRTEESAESLERIYETRQIIASLDGFNDIQIIYNSNNKGLSKSIIYGIEKVFETNNKIIVLEDDIVVSTYFLRYMNWGLNKFESDLKIATIQAFQFPVFKNKQEFFLDKAVGCWGWGTWKHQWENFEIDPEKLLKKLIETGREREFNLNDSYNFFELLEQNKDKKIDSWAIRWYASLFLKNKLNLYPTITLAKNIGNDGSGTHNERNYSNNIFGSFNENKLN
ncbi:MAG: glycosyl transferase, partial [Burkholderiales bacterium PBB4]